MNFISRASTLVALMQRDGMRRLVQRWIDRRLIRDYAGFIRAQEAGPTPAFPDNGLTLSIVMPVYKPRLVEIAAAIGSVRAQRCQSWELCIVDDGSNDAEVGRLLERAAAEDARVKIKARECRGHISRATNDAASMARGEFLLFMDQDDLLGTNAVGSIVATLYERPDTVLLFADEDKLDRSGRFGDPYLKPELDPVLLRYQNAICHPMVVRRSLFEELGGLRIGVEGAQDWDLALRVVECSDPRTIVHLPQILYHWRKGVGSTAGSLSAKSYVVQAQAKVVAEHCVRVGIRARVEVVPSRVPIRLRREIENEVTVVVVGEGATPMLISPPFGELTQVPQIIALRGWSPNGRDVLVLAAGCVPRGAADLERLFDGLVHPEIDLVCGVVESKHGRVVSAGFFADREFKLRDLHEGASAYSDGHGNSLIIPHEIAAPHAAAFLIRARVWERVRALIEEEATPREWMSSISRIGLRSIVVPESRFIVRASSNDLAACFACGSGEPLRSVPAARRLHPQRSECPPQLGLEHVEITPHTSVGARAAPLRGLR